MENTKKRMVLIVDDDASWQALKIRVLRELLPDHSFRTAECMQTAVPLVLRNYDQLALVVVDMTIPYDSSLDFLTSISNNGSYAI